jgi:hypothetical protein
MSEQIQIAVISVLGIIVGSIITQTLNWIANRKNNLVMSLQNAAEALHMTSDELVEALVEVKGLKSEVRSRDRRIETLKNITRKMYAQMKVLKIKIDLTDEELESLFETQPLALLAEKQRREKEERE